MNKRVVRQSSVSAIANITSNMRRITLSGESIQDISNDQIGGYIKLMLPLANGEQCVRTFTVRAYRPELNEIDIDFALHGDQGPASAWATNAKIGDTLNFGGPAPKKGMDTSADWFFLIGDMTSLPAISVNLENLPTDAKGYAIFLINSEQDKQTLVAPADIEIHWLVNDDADTDCEQLNNYVRQLSLLEGRVNVWLACEFSGMRKLRQYFKKELKLARNDVYASSYWKRGLAEDEHKVAKRQDAEIEEAS